MRVLILITLINTSVAVFLEAGYCVVLKLLRTQVAECCMACIQGPPEESSRADAWGAASKEG